MFVYVWEHIAFPTKPIDRCYQSWLDEVIMALHMRLGFSARSAQRLIQGGAKLVQWGALNWNMLIVSQDERPPLSQHL